MRMRHDMRHMRRAIARNFVGSHWMLTSDGSKGYTPVHHPHLQREYDCVPSSISLHATPFTRQRRMLSAQPTKRLMQ